MRALPRFLLAVTLVAVGARMAPAQVYVAYTNVGLISEYDQDSGALLSEMFVLGLKQPRSLCYANGLLYVVQTGTGSIGTFDPRTGAAVRPELVSGLNMPQAMTVSGGALYVADFDWQTHQPRVGKYNAITGAVINPSLVKITGAKVNDMIMTPMAPSALAVSGNRLLMGSAGQASSASIYDTTTGAPIDAKFSHMVSAADKILVEGRWIWLVAGANSTGAVILKFDPESSQSSIGLDLFVQPFIRDVDFPRQLAISGDELFVGKGPGTTVAKYNATTGTVINANFIASKGDIMGGLAVAPRSSTEQQTAADSQVEFKHSLTDLAFYLLQNWQYIFLASCLVVLALVGGVLAALFHRARPLPAPVEEITAPEEAAFVPEEIPVIPEAPPAPAAAPPPVEPFSRLAVAAFVLFTATLVTTGFVAYDLYTAPTLYGPPDEHDLIGAWGFDNDALRDPSEDPVFRSLWVYATHAEYSEGAGPYNLPGTWHDNGFWIANPDGSGETEIAHLTDPLDIEVHVHAFMPQRSDLQSLYKTVGSPAEQQAIAAKYPAPLTYPPPKGVITYNMTEYDLNSLPWKPAYASRVGEHAYSLGELYHYRSDNPKIPRSKSRSKTATSSKSKAAMSSTPQAHACERRDPSE